MKKKEDILSKIDDLALMISNKYENIHVYNGKDVRDILEDMLLTGSTAEEINDLIECDQIVYKDGELIIDIKDTDILLELQGEKYIKYINLVTEHLYLVKLINKMEVHNVSGHYRSYCKLSEQLEEIKSLAIQLAKIDGQLEK